MAAAGRESVWVVRRQEPERAGALAESLGVSPLVAQILLHRGIDEPGAARAFLNPALEHLREPEAHTGLEQAAKRVLRAARDGEPVAVYGDYDVDGISGTALLTRFIEMFGGTVRTYIPDRLHEGYGLNLAAVRQLEEEGIRLLVTVDHGTTAVKEIAAARKAGMDVVVLDHHPPSEHLPDTTALVNPHLDGFPGAQACGVGVAFRVAWAMARAASGGPRVAEVHRRFLAEALGLVALGTVSDVVPLRDENRIFTRFGLEMLTRCPSLGVRALISVARLEGRKITAGDVGFKLAPRINAAGRMGRVELALELLLTEDADRAGEIASTLDRENRKRREIETRIFEEACEKVEAKGDLEGPGAIVLGDPSWHVGVVGIVASRLVNRYHRPAVMVAFDNGIGRGSCRSIDGAPLPELLGACAEHLEAHGGHARAAGLTVRDSRFDEFRRAFEKAVRERVREEDFIRKLVIDLVTPLSTVTLACIRDLERLEPFGEGNPRPLFASRRVRVAGKVRRMGKKGEHLGFLVSDGGPALRAVGFRMGARSGEVAAATGEGEARLDLAYTPGFDEWRNDGSLELRLEDFTVSHGRVRD